MPGHFIFTVCFGVFAVLIIISGGDHLNWSLLFLALISGTLIDGLRFLIIHKGDRKNSNYSRS